MESITEYVTQYWAYVLAGLAGLTAAMPVLKFFEITPKNIWTLIKKLRGDKPLPPAPLPSGIRKVVGREGALKDLAEKLKGDGKVAITGKAVVHGAGGLGKSTLAREFLARNAERYDIRLWVDAETVETASGSIFADLCPALGIELPDTQSPAAARAVMNGLVASGKSALVVFDNVDDFDAIKALLPEGDKVDLIITTRSTGYPGYAAVALDVLGFETEDSPAVELLLQEAERGDDRAGARDLAKALGGLPLALVTAGRLLRGGTESFAEYQTRLDEILMDAPPQGDDYPDSIRAAVKLSYEKLEPDAKWVADLFAWWAPEGLDGALITDAPGGPYWDKYRGDIPDALADLSTVSARVAQALRQMEALSLIDVEGAGYTMHRLTAHSLRLGSDQAARIAAAAVLKAQYFGGREPSLQINWPLCRRLTPHARSLWASQSAPQTEAMDVLLNQCAIFLGTQDDLAGTIDCLRAALELRDARLGEEHFGIPLALGNLSQQLVKISAKEEAQSMIARAVALDEAHRPNSAQLATRYMQAAAVHYELGISGDAEQFFKALDWVSKAKPIRASKFDAKSEEMAHCFSIESVLKDATGDLAGAIVADKAALEIRRDGDAALLELSLANLGSKLLKAGFPEDAVDLLKDSLDICDEIFADMPGHFSLKNTAQWLAVALLVHGRSGVNPSLRETEAKKVCYDYGLDFEQMKKNAEGYPLTPQIELPE